MSDITITVSIFPDKDRRQCRSYKYNGKPRQGRLLSGETECRPWEIEWPELRVLRDYTATITVHIQFSCGVGSVDSTFPI